MNPLITNAQPFSLYVAPMTLGTKLIVMDALASSPRQEVPVDVWAGVLNVYHSYNMSVQHLPQLSGDGRRPFVVRSKEQVLDEIREKLDIDAHRVSKYASTGDFKQEDIHLVKDHLTEMVGRRVISSDPADALMLSARRCLDGVSAVDTNSQTEECALLSDEVMCRFARTAPVIPFLIGLGCMGLSCFFGDPDMREAAKFVAMEMFMIGGVTAVWGTVVLRSYKTQSDDS
jgi:hypothetical protein